MAATESNITDTKDMSFEALIKAMREADILPKPDKWTVIDPQGRIYQGTVDQMTILLAQAHPLFSQPTAFKFGGA
jgi:hypothetical protein